MGASSSRVASFPGLTSTRRIWVTDRVMTCGSPARARFWRLGRLGFLFMCPHLLKQVTIHFFPVVLCMAVRTEHFAFINLTLQLVNVRHVINEIANLHVLIAAISMMKLKTSRMGNTTEVTC